MNTYIEKISNKATEFKQRVAKLAGEGRWVTINGRHILLEGDESPMEGLKRVLASPSNKDSGKSDFLRNKSTLEKHGFIPHIKEGEFRTKAGDPKKSGWEGVIISLRANGSFHLDTYGKGKNQSAPGTADELTTALRDPKGWKSAAQRRAEKNK